MLEHQKMIIKEVSYSEELFRKEIIKSFKWLKSHELVELHQWLDDNFVGVHKDIVKNTFQTIAA